MTHDLPVISLKRQDARDAAEAVIKFHEAYEEVCRIYAEHLVDLLEERVARIDSEKIEGVLKDIHDHDLWRLSHYADLALEVRKDLAK